MDWSSPSDFLALWMTVYVCLGVVLCTVMTMYYISKNSLDQNKFAFCVEMILAYGPIGIILLYWDIKKLVKYLWTRDYKGWYERHKENIQEWRKARKRLREQTKNFRTKQKK